MKANKIICPIFLCLFVFQLLGTFSFAQSDSSQERFQKILRLKSLVDTLYQDHYNNQNLPGLSYAVMVDEKIAFITGAGYQNIQSKTKVSANSVFRIASMTKSFTALAILKLRDEGKLKLDDASRLYVPEMMDWKHRLSSSPITIRQLLTHMAGFPEDNPWGDRQLSRSEAELSALLISQPAMSNAPGMEFEYSNLGYALLGRIIKNISGQSYQEYISNQILNPLGMHQTYWEVNNVPANQLAQGYRRSGTVYHKEPILPDGSFASMGGMLTTMVDFVKYMQLHMQAWSGGEDSTLFVLKSTLREMHMPHTISGLNTGFQLLSNNTCALVAGYSYGLRWWKDCSNKNYAGHSGGLPGYGSNWMFLPEYGIGIVAFSNVTYASFTNFHISVLDTLIKRSGINRAVASSDILESRKKVLLTFLPEWKNAVGSGIFAENFFSDQPLEELKRTTATIFNQIGRIKNIGVLVPTNQLRGSFILYGEKGSAEVFFTLSPEHLPRIQHFRIRSISK